MFTCGGVGEVSETYDDTHAVQHGELSLEETGAFLSFKRQGLVVWRCTPDRNGHPCILQCESVVAMRRRFLVCQTGAGHRSVEPVAAAIASEDPACAVGSVSAWSKPKDNDPGIGITESSDWFSPVFLVSICRTALLGHGLTPTNQTGTRPAGFHICLQSGERVTCRTSSSIHHRRRYEMRG